jgi:hypothetical protein
MPKEEGDGLPLGEDGGEAGRASGSAAKQTVARCRCCLVEERREQRGFFKGEKRGHRSEDKMEMRPDLGREEREVVGIIEAWIVSLSTERTQRHMGRVK